MAILDRATLTTNANDRFPDNNDREIEESDVRDQSIDEIDSAYNRVTDSLLLNLRDYQSGRGDYQIGEGAFYDAGGGTSIYRAVNITGGAFNAADWVEVASGGGGGATANNGLDDTTEVGFIGLGGTLKRDTVISTDDGGTLRSFTVQGGGSIVLNTSTGLVTSSIGIYGASGTFIQAFDASSSMTNSVTVSPSQTLMSVSNASGASNIQINPTVLNMGTGTGGMVM